MTSPRAIGTPLAAVLALLCSGCPPPPPPPGELALRVNTPNADDRAFRISVRCPEQPRNTAPETGFTGYSSFHGIALDLIVVRQNQQVIPSGTIVAHFAVDNIREACSASVMEVAHAGYGVRESLAGYAVTLEPVSTSTR